MKDGAPICTIVMATFDGMPFVVEQVESIQAQTEQRWLLVASDDGSTDGTLEWLREAAAADSRIRVVRNPGPHGPYENFHHAIELCRGHFSELFAGAERTPYFFFADQDDVWMPDKIEAMISELARLEAQAGPDVPVFCFCDRELIDGEGKALGHLTSETGEAELVESPLHIFFVHRYVAGTAMALNRPLFDLPVWPRECVGDVTHDCLFVRHAALFGDFSFIDRPLVRYRRHRKNVSELPHRYGPIGAIRRVVTDFSDVIDGSSRVYWNSMVMLSHIPCETDLSRGLRECFERGRLVAVRFCLVHHVHPGNVFTTALMFFNLFTRAYKRTSWFTDRAHVRAMAPDPDGGS